MSENLKNKTVKGVIWSFVDNIGNQGITFLVGIVLARLLSPEEYGLIGIITIFIAIFNSIVDSGLSNALIRKEKITEQDYNTVFISNMVISIVLFVVMYLSAPLIASFFEQPLLTALTRAMSFIIIVNALAIIHRTKLVKCIDFKTQTKISVASSIISGAIGIYMAIIGMGVWSLVGQLVVRQVLNTVLLWVASKWYPKLQFSWRSFKELFGFGWKLMASCLIDTIWREIYQIVVGKFYSAATLGQYARAHQFSSIFSSNITAVIQRVSYPVLSSIKDDPERLKQAYRKVLKITMFITFVLMFGLAATSRPLIVVLLGDQWMEAASFLPILCFQMVLYPLHAINLNILQVYGRSDLFLKLEIIKKIVAILPLVLGILVDIYWMLWCSVLTGIFAYYLNSYYSGKLLNYSIFQQIKDISPSMAIALIMSALIHLITYMSISPMIQLATQLLAGMVILILLCKLTKINEYSELKKILYSLKNRKALS